MNRTISISALLLAVALSSCSTTTETIPEVLDFSVETEKSHYVILRLPQIEEIRELKGQTQQISKDLGYFHDGFTRLNIEVQKIAREPIITVREFDNHLKASEFADQVARRLDIETEYEIEDVLPISSHNYRQLRKVKSVEAYSEFYYALVD